MLVLNFCKYHKVAWKKYNIKFTRIHLLCMLMLMLVSSCVHMCMHACIMTGR